VVALSLVGLIGCTPDLPESESAAAKLYLERCGGCHRLYAPNVMTKATWKAMLQRMQGEMRRRGVPPLSADEMAMLQAYLDKHALDAGAKQKGVGG